MTLYHFTSIHHLEGCKREGLTKGVIVMAVGPAGMFQHQNGWRWLTVNPSWEQSWNVRQRVKYDRAEYRITLFVPPSHYHRLKNWWHEGSILTPLFDQLCAFGDPHNWWVYHGDIPPSWFRRIDHRPITTV